jgi:YD repeat-containing protein
MHASAPSPAPRHTPMTSRPKIIDYRGEPRKQLLGTPRTVPGEPTHPMYPSQFATRLNAPITPQKTPPALKPPARLAMRAATTVHPMTAPTATPSSAPTTGITRWWTYSQGTIPGVGEYAVNVGTGNLIVQADDLDIPERGVDLSFKRTYNSQSQHDAENDDGSVQSNFGDGWTNSFDAHLGTDGGGTTPNVVSVYDISGARYDYTLSTTLSGGAAIYAPPTGMQGTTLDYDGSCSFYWTLKSGVQYIFWAPFPTGCNPTSDAGYFGRINYIYGRNSGNYLHFVYSWITSNGITNNASSSNNLSSIAVNHSDGQSLTLEFATFANSIHPELSHIVRPDGDTIDFYYDTTTGTHLTEVDKPGHLTGGLISEYAYNESEQLNYICSPRYAFASENGTNDGGCTLFSFAPTNINGVTNNNVTTGAWNWVWANFAPPDSTGASLQPNLNSGYYYVDNRTFSYEAYPSSNSTWQTTMTDTDGHTLQYYVDAEGRLNQTDAWVGGPNTNWLITYLTWNANNDLISGTDAMNNVTNAAYDANGNVVEIGQPSVSTSAGTVRPTTLISYDSYNNVVAYCDPVQVNSLGLNWGTATVSDSMCPTGTGATGATQIVYNYDADESFGMPVNVYNPLGYEETISYSSGAPSDNYGLPTQVAGTTAIRQNDGTSLTPTETLGYDAYGNVTSLNRGNGATTATFDDFNRPITITDADGVTSRRCYNPDSTVQADQSARQYALDGSVCGSNSVSYTYDMDGDLYTRTNHFGGVPGPTTYWYDGDDRMVEVMQPADATIDGNQPGRTRYIYDLSQGGSNLEVANGPYFAAHGNLYKTQRCNWATIGASACTWTDISGTAFDSANRTVEQFRYQPFGSVEGWTIAWDQNGFTGLPTMTTDPLGIQTTLTYTADNQKASIAFSDGSALTRTYVYDPDGRVSSVSSGTASATSIGGGIIIEETSMSDLFGYDANGDLTGTQEESYSGTGRPPACCTESSSYPSVSYTYYPNGWRSSLTEGGPTFSASNPELARRANTARQDCTSCGSSSYDITMDYSYRSDGLRQTLSLSNESQPFTWTYTNAGRMLTQSDPYTGTSYPANSKIGAGTFGPKTFTYDAYGTISGETFPTGTAYSAMTYDAEGENNGYSISMPSLSTSGPYATAAALGYNIRGELTKESFTSSVGAETPVNLTYNYDAPTGYGTIDPITGAIEPSGCSFDLDGRLTGCLPPSDASATLAYDAENHLLYGNPASGASEGALAWGNLGSIFGYYFGAASSASVSNGSILHWDGNQLLYSNLGSSSSPTLTQWNVEDLAQANCGTATSSSTCQPLTVVDRDPSGLQVDAHGAGGSLGTTVAPNYYTMENGLGGAYLNVVVGQYPPVGGATAATGVFTQMRPDGYQFGPYAVQGSRAMNSATGQWMTPDWYPGTLDNPLSQRAYTWNGNNPVTMSDPTGFDGSVICDTTVVYDANNNPIDSTTCQYRNPFAGLDSIPVMIYNGSGYITVPYGWIRPILRHIAAQGEICAFQCWNKTITGCGATYSGQGLGAGTNGGAFISVMAGVVIGNPDNVLTAWSVGGGGGFAGGGLVGLAGSANGSGLFIGISFSSSGGTVSGTAANKTGNGVCGQ